MAGQQRAVQLHIPQPSSKSAKAQTQRQNKLKKQLSESFDSLNRKGEDFMSGAAAESKTFKKLQVFKDGMSALRKYKCVGVVGGPCSGKTTLIRQMIYTFRQENSKVPMTPIQVKKSGQLDEISSDLSKSGSILLIIDDMLGKYTHEEVGSWLSDFELIKSLIRKKKDPIVIIFAIHTLNYNKSKIKLNGEYMFQHVIHLHDREYMLNKDDKRDMLNLKLGKLNLSQKIIEDICAKSTLGLFYTLRHREKKIDYDNDYEEPYDLIWKDIVQTLAQKEIDLLTFMLLKGGKLNLKENEPTDRAKFHHFKHVLDNIKELCNKLCNVYLKSEDGLVYTFIEPVVQDTILRHSVLSDKDKNNVLNYCSLNIIMSAIWLKIIPVHELNDENDYKILAKRISDYISDKSDKHLARLLEFKCLRYDGQFLEKLIVHFDTETLKKPNSISANKVANTLFTAVCADGDVSCLEFLIQYLNPDDHPLDSKGRSPFEAIVRSTSNNNDIVSKKLEVLIRKQFNFANVDSHGSNILHLLTEKRSSQCLKDVLKLPNVRSHVTDYDSGRRTPLHTACIEGKKEAAQLFLEFCDNESFVNEKDRKNRTALHYAVESYEADGCDTSLQLIQLLKSKGASIDCRDSKERIPLHEILHCKSNVSEVLDLLVGNDDSLVNVQDKDGLTPLHLAVKAGNLQAVQYLMQKGADIDIQESEEDMTALMLACQRSVPNSIEIAKVLLDGGPNLNTKNVYGLTALHEAIEEGNIECLEEILKNEADPNAKCSNEIGRTAINIIFKLPVKVAFEMFKILKKYGADLSIANARGETIFELADPDLLVLMQDYLQNSDSLSQNKGR